MSPEKPHVFVDDELVFRYEARTSSCAPFTGAAPPRFVGRWRERRAPRGCSARSFVASQTIWIPSRMSDAEIADELIRRRAEIDRLEAEFAQLAWAGHRRGIGAADGSPSTPAWLRRHTGMREGDARGAIEAGCGVRVAADRSVRRGATVRSPVARRKTIAAARVEGHDLKLRALEDVLLMLARADDQRELRRGVCPLPQLRPCRRHRTARARRADDLRRLRRTDRVIQADLSSTARRDRRAPRSTRSPTRPPTATPAPRPAAAPTPSSGWPNSRWRTSRC